MSSVPDKSTTRQASRQDGQHMESKKNNTSTMQGFPPITTGANGGSTAEVEKDTAQAQKTGEKKKKVKKAKLPKLIFNLYYTVYPIIKRVAKEQGFRVRTDDVQLVPPPLGSEEYYLRQSVGFQP